MSIPKEPRQLMINLMYLVLTALLALNVSAEVMNAFFTLNKGIQSSNKIVDVNNDAIKQAINKQAEAYKNPINEQYKVNAEKTIVLTKEFNDYIEGIRKMIFDAAGGPSDKDPLRPRMEKDKDITTRLLVYDNRKQKDGVGVELEKKIRTLRNELSKMCDNDPGTLKSISLDIEELPKNTDKKNWADFKFRQMPVAAVFPMLSKIEADAKTSSTAILNYINTKVGGTEMKFDKFKVALAPKTGYVIKGEKFEADVYLAAFSSNPGSGVTITVNGRGLPVKEGVANYSTIASSIGKQTVKASASIKNPLTGEVKTVTTDFDYEVGERSVAVSADKMNVFYIGVDNPVSVSAAGVNSTKLNVGVSGAGGGSITKSGSNSYIVKVSKPTALGEFCYVTANAEGLSDKKPFRVKRIPDPVARLSSKQSGSMGTGEFKAQGGVGAFLDNFDFDAKCTVVAFTLVRVPKRQDAIREANEGPRYTGKCRGLVDLCKPGDVYYFEDVKARCPGDAVSRPINPLVFSIK
ncbi:MAG TPA: GldM family protein [Saprospiraceae bacterium]|nr:GldM family protein [Saprospiraceae bacterium]